MIKLLFLFGFLYSCSGMSLSAQSSKTMTLTSPDGAKKMFVEHASQSDLEGSASGYIYRSDGKGPATIVQLGEPHFVAPHDFTQFVNHGYESFIEPVKFAPIKYENLGGHYYGGEQFGGQHFLAGGEGEYLGGLGKEKFVQEKGLENNKEFYHSGGEKGAKGYKDFEEFNKELIKKLLENQEEGYNKQAGGDKKSHFEKGEKYEDVKEEKKGEDGENFSSNKSHKKGHKTTGFHNVYHKDEFKKQHSFFDEADDDGHHEKYGGNHEAFGAEGGNYKKEGHANSGHHSGEFLKKGDFHKGDFQSAAKGFKESEGSNSHYANNAEYGKKGGKTFHKDFGFGGHSGYGEEY